MRVDILTLFPEMFESPLSSSIIKRAQDNGLIEIALTNIRDFSTDNYRKVDDKPYGGGPGMVMMPGPVFDCFEHVQKLSPEKGRVLLLTPQGQKFDQEKARHICAKTRSTHALVLSSLLSMLKTTINPEGLYLVCTWAGLSLAYLL